jgi:CRM1 C terminal
MVFITDGLIQCFPNLNRLQVEAYVLQMFTNCEDWKAFKGTMNDIMISLRSFSSQQNDFYEHQKKVANEKALKKQRDMMTRLSSQR